MTTNRADITALLSSAATIGRETKEEMASAKARLDSAKSHAAEAMADADDKERHAMGFGSPMFLGLGRVARAFSRVNFNDPDGQEATDAANAAARAFAASMTGATDDTLKGGGTLNAYAAVVRLGDHGANLIYTMQSRLMHWYELLDSAKSMDDASAKKATRELAQRYTSLIGRAPTESGEWPRKGGAADGEPQKPTHNGRPARVAHGVPIGFAGAKDRKAMLADAARLFRSYGEAVFHPDVIDALLDNGGKYVAPEAGPRELAAQALGKVQALLMAGGQESADAAILVHFTAVLSRIENEGFKSANIAPPTPPASDADDILGDDSVGGAESEGEGEGDAPKAKRRRGGRL
jgi:hypothetical protein